MRRYQANGFIPFAESPSRITRQMAMTITVVKGDIMIDDGSGYATNTAVLFAATVLGPAAEDHTGGATDGAESIEIFPLDFDTLYIVPVAGSTAISRDAVGTYVDLETNGTIDITDIVTEGLSFFIEDIDISTDAIAANTAGYAIGRFRNLTTQNSA